MRLGNLLFITAVVTCSCWAHAESSEKSVASTFQKSEESVDRLSITKYNPIYFAYGEPATKVQFSFKYQLVDKVPLYFAYTQLMFWNLGLDSKPFKDVNYSPEVFYHFDVSKGVLSSVDFSPYAHLSNGRDGSASRTINRMYIRFNFEAPLSEGVIKLAATLMGSYGNNEDNGDIYKYVSPLDLRFAISQFIPWVFDRGELYVRVFPGGSYAEHWDLGAQEVGLSFRLGGVGLKPSIYFQYYNGYAESFLGYNHSSSQFRAGIML